MLFLHGSKSRKSRSQLPANSAGLKEHKPAEWSDEDKKTLNEIIGVIKLIKSQPLRSLEDWEGYVRFLESLHPQPKEDWTEYDETHLKWLCRIVHSRRIHGELSLAEESELGVWMDKWLNHNPQPHWKPNEDQMIALDGMLEHWSGNKCQKEILESLLEQLEKLR